MITRNNQNRRLFRASALVVILARILPDDNVLQSGPVPESKSGETFCERNSRQC